MNLDTSKVDDEEYFRHKINSLNAKEAIIMHGYVIKQPYDFLFNHQHFEIISEFLGRINMFYFTNNSKRFKYSRT